MNRYNHHFLNLPKYIRAIPTQRVGFASIALFEHRANGFGADEDDAIVRQFDLDGMAEFWEIQLAEPMACVDFIRSLAGHLYKVDWRPGLSEEEQKKLGPAAERGNDSVKAGIRQALRAARSYGEPWFTAIPDPPPSSKLDLRTWVGFVPSDAVIVPPDPPADGINLNKLRVQPRAAAEWMLSNPMRRHLVPPSLAAVLRPSPATVDTLAVPTLDVPRRRGPKAEVGPRVEMEMRKAMRDGVDLRGMKQEEMAVRFKASQSVCRGIRRTILGKIGGN